MWNVDIILMEQVKSGEGRKECDCNFQTTDLEEAVEYACRSALDNAFFATISESSSISHFNVYLSHPTESYTVQQAEGPICYPEEEFFEIEEIVEYIQENN